MTEETQGGTGSEWNEQQAFSKLFFAVTADCKITQSRLNLIGWRECLFAKLSLVMGVCNVDEKNGLYHIRNKVLKTSTKFIQSPNSKTQYALYDILFISEAEVDTIAHKHMPFLKLKRQTDIGGM